MRYVSTRGEAPVLNFDDVLLTGLAADGGLYLPDSWPRFDAGMIQGLRGTSYADLAIGVMTPYLGGRIPPSTFNRMVHGAYASFDDADVAPLRLLSDDIWVMELFHGPTLAFKDYALQLVGRLFDHVLRTRGEKITIVGATSGDTGSAAIEACRDRERLDIFILHPKGRVSEVQRRQMTTVDAPNVHNVAIEGTFDDCQALVKAMFNDSAFRRDLHLSAVNSINWARILGQIVYYVWAAVNLGAPDRGVSFAVPTGNFGNVFAGYAASRMDLPIPHLAVATNTNDILARFFETGAMTQTGVVPTLSPSMDIQVSSNFERLLFELYDRDGATVRELMAESAKTGSFAVAPERWERAGRVFSGHRVDDEGTLAAIRQIHRDFGMVVDPHSAIGIAAARECRDAVDGPIVALATAHPAKFPDAVERAIGVRSELPPHMADLYERDEHVSVLPNDLIAVQSFVRERAALKGAA